MANRGRPSVGKKVFKPATIETLYKEFKEIRYKLDENSDEDASFVLKCLEICTQNELAAEDFMNKFDAWRFTLKIKTKSTLADLDKLRTHIAEQLDAERRKAEKSKGAIRVKTDKTAAPASLIRPTQRTQVPSYDHASLSSQLSAKPTADMVDDDMMDDDFLNGGDDAIVVKKEPIDSPAKRKIADVAGGDEDESKDGGSNRKRANIEGEESTTNQDGGMEVNSQAALSSAASAAVAHFQRTFRPSFRILGVDADGNRNEALYPKALGKYSQRTNAGEKAVALNDVFARLEPSDEDWSAEQKAEIAKRIIEIEVYQPSEDLLQDIHRDPEEEAKESTPSAPAPTPAKALKYVSKTSNKVHATSAGGLQTQVFRYMYQNEDELREGLDENLSESQQIMMDKPEFQSMRQLIKSEKPSLASTLVSPHKPVLRQTEIVVKKEPVVEEKKDAPMEEEKKESDVEMTDATSSTPPAASATPSSPTTATPATTITIPDEDDDGDLSNLLPLVSIAASKSQQSVILAGRVVYDANDTSGETSSEVVQKLTTPNTIWIEGDKTLNNGARIPVRLNGLKSYAVFPGQIVLAKGINATGSSFVAEELFTDASLAHAGMKRALVEKYNASLGYRPLGIMFASGPFTTSEDLSYAPLFDLLREACRVKPDILLLQGPFLDAEHKDFVANEGSVTATYDILFLRLLRDIMTHVAHLPTKVLIVPSVRDASAIPIFPQPAFPAPSSIYGGGQAAADLQRDMQKGKLYFLPNPCTFRVNDIVIGCSSMDIISHLGNSNELSKQQPAQPGQPEPQGRLQRLSSHLITSHSYYPLFPAPDGVFLDYSHVSSLKMQVTPDLLFLPSKLNRFVSEIQPYKTIVVNPETLAKGPSAGMYALVSIHPLKEEEMVPPPDTNGRLYDHCMMTRTRVDIIRI